MSSTEDTVKWEDHCTMELAQQGLIHLKNDEMGLVVWAILGPAALGPLRTCQAWYSGMGPMDPAGLVPPQNYGMRPVVCAQQGWFHLRTCGVW